MAGSSSLGRPDVLGAPQRRLGWLADKTPYQRPHQDAQTSGGRSSCPAAAGERRRRLATRQGMTCIRRACLESGMNVFGSSSSSDGRPTGATSVDG